MAASLFVSACGSATVEYTVSEDGTHYIISGVSGNKSSLAVYDIPATFDDGEHGELPVTEIGESAFMGCSLARVTIPDSITYIGDLAFAYNYIYDLVLPESLEYIGYGAFAYSSAVEELVIPASVTQLGPFAFAYCGKLSKVEVLAQVDTIYIGTFRGIVANDTSGVYYDTNLTEVRFPATLKNLHRDALADNFITDIYYAGTAAQWQEVEIFSYPAGPPPPPAPPPPNHRPSNNPGAPPSKTLLRPGGGRACPPPPTAVFCIRKAPAPNMLLRERFKKDKTLN